MNNAALDGVGRGLHNYYQSEVQSGETVEYVMKGELKIPEHKLMSLAGNLYDNTERSDGLEEDKFKISSK